MSILGVGAQRSAFFAATVDEAGRFRQSRNAGAYFGLGPMRNQSGAIDWTGRITKHCNGTMRKLLYEAANSILSRCQETLRTDDMSDEDRETAQLQKDPCRMGLLTDDGTLFLA